MFIVLEGIDGCGKSTQAKLLADWLQAHGRDVLLTAEPTTGRIGRFLREILSGKAEVDPKTLALLFTADRAEHLAREIEPALARGMTVVSERYILSTICYQAAQDVSEKWLCAINEFARKPDYTFLLDVTPGESMKRKAGTEIFEEKEFLKKVRANYLRMKKDAIVIDGRRRPEETFHDIIGRLGL
ncbi:MAG: dTMP kinase [Candidatus Altiarchaeota archaeon]|nr:dTMP kinase [Candidatus Altiarchaeota archaeon]